MKSVRINALLTVTMLVMTLVPIAAALYFANNAVATSLHLGFNPEVKAALAAHAQHLKQLGKLDPDRQADYRAEFEKLLDLQSVFEGAQLAEQSIRHSLLIYFALGIAAAALISIGAAALLSRRISRSYRATFAELIEQRDRNRYLEEIGSWQELAKMLVHEIKNPLTPIKVSITALAKSYDTGPADKFGDLLQRTERMIAEELDQLNKLVDKFGDLAKLPQLQLSNVNLTDTLIQQTFALNALFSGARVRMGDPEMLRPIPVMLDTTLFRQVLVNIVRNGLEANPGRIVTFTIAMATTHSAATISIANDGVAVPHEIAPRLFDPYVSGKSGGGNMGLGLAIARKILLDHGGDVTYHEAGGQPVFTLLLPRPISK